MIAGALAIIVALLLATGSPAARQTRLSPWLDTAVRQARATDRLAVWVYFTDKEGAATARPHRDGEGTATPGSRGTPSAATAFEDRALSPAYVRRVAGLVERVRQQSRWLNAVSVEATPAQIARVEALPFVARAGRRAPLPPAARGADRAAGDRGAPRPRRAPARGRRRSTTAPSSARCARSACPRCTSAGLHGEGVVVAVFDTGFHNLAHEAFASMTIVAEHDFVERRRRCATATGEGSHGTKTLSDAGRLRARASSWARPTPPHFILAKTEDTRSETPVEEDNWAAAAEWAEALGADVISSSLGYLDLRPARSPSYTVADMNGETAIRRGRRSWRPSAAWWWSTPPATRGSNPTHNTLGAPADGVRVRRRSARSPAPARGRRSARWAPPPTAASSPTWRRRASA